MAVGFGDHAQRARIERDVGEPQSGDGGLDLHVLALLAKLGDRLTVRLPSGEERQGTVFYRSVDAGFATQRDVSRTKRDIKTFEVRLRVDNSDRMLAVGMTAYVLLPPQAP